MRWKLDFQGQKRQQVILEMLAAANNIREVLVVTSASAAPNFDMLEGTRPQRTQDALEIWISR